MDWTEVGTIVAVVVGFKAFITGCKALVASFKDKTESTTDNKIYAVLEKIEGFLGVIK